MRKSISWASIVVSCRASLHCKTSRLSWVRSGVRAPSVYFVCVNCVCVWCKSRSVCTTCVCMNACLHSSVTPLLHTRECSKITAGAYVLFFSCACACACACFHKCVCMCACACLCGCECSCVGCKSCSMYTTCVCISACLSSVITSLLNELRPVVNGT